MTRYIYARAACDAELKVSRDNGDGNERWFHKTVRASGNEWEETKGGNQEAADYCRLSRALVVRPPLTLEDSRLQRRRERGNWERVDQPWTEP